MRTVLLNRERGSDKQTLGTMIIVDTKDIFFTLELPWKDNKRNVSCIPVGEYTVKWTYSPKYKRKMYLVSSVPNRSGIRIHSGNYYTDILGCVLLGDSHTDINKDGYADVTNSRNTIKKFEGIMNGESFVLKITQKK